MKCREDPSFAALRHTCHTQDSVHERVGFESITLPQTHHLHPEPGLCVSSEGFPSQTLQHTPEPTTNIPLDKLEENFFQAANLDIFIAFTAKYESILLVAHVVTHVWRMPLSSLFVRQTQYGVYQDHGSRKGRGYGPID